MFRRHVEQSFCYAEDIANRRADRVMGEQYKEMYFALGMEQGALYEEIIHLLGRECLEKDIWARKMEYAHKAIFSFTKANEAIKKTYENSRKRNNSQIS